MEMKDIARFSKAIVDVTGRRTACESFAETSKGAVADLLMYEHTSPHRLPQLTKVLLVPKPLRIILHFDVGVVKLCNQ